MLKWIRRIIAENLQGSENHVATGASGNPYELAEQVWSDRHGSYQSLARQAQIVTGIGVIVLAASIAALIVVKSREGYVPFLVSSSELIPPRALETASISRLPEGVARRELATFVERLRSIPADQEVLRRDVARLFAFLAPSTAGERRTMEFLEDPERTPRAFLGQLTRRVEVTSVVYKGGNSWVVEWREVVSPNDPNLAPLTGLYQGTLVVGEAEPQDADALATNPFGLFVQDYWFDYLGDG